MKGSGTGKGRLKHFVKDGLWSSISEGFAETHFNSFATLLSATSDQLSLFVSGQSFATCGLQLWSDHLLKIFKSAKLLVLLCVGLQILILLSSTFILFTFGMNAYCFMILATLYTAIGGLSGPVWSSWVSDLIPDKRKGLCFGIRNQRTYPASFISIILAGLALEKLELWFHGKLALHFAFCSIFMVGVLAKAFSFYHLYRQPVSPKMTQNGDTLGPIKLLTETLSDSATRRLICFFSLASFGVNISAAIQAPYLLQSLHFSYFKYASIIGIHVFARFLIAPFAGKIIDQQGSRTPLLYSVILMPFISFGWCISSEYSWILTIQVISGLIWGVFDLSAFTILSECSLPSEKHRVFAVKHLSSNLAAAAAPILGGFLLRTFHWEQSAFFGSFIFRGLTVILAFRALGEQSPLFEKESLDSEAA